MLRKLCALLVIFFLESSHVWAQVALKPQFPEGSKFTEQTEERTLFAFKTGGMVYDSTTTVFGITTTSIGNRDSNGSLTCERKYDSLQSETALPGGVSVRFDSIEPGKSAEVPEFESVFGGLRAQLLPVVLVLDAENKIASASLRAGEFEKLSELNQCHFNPAALKQTAERYRAFLPDAPVKEGDTWERSTVTQDNGTVITFRTRFEYVGTVERDGVTLDKIVGKPFEVTYVVLDKAEYQANVPDVKITEGDSTYLFDRNRGILVSRESKVRLAGSMTITVEGTAIDGTFETTLEERAVRQK
jgi:hypothetical protein